MNRINVGPVLAPVAKFAGLNYVHTDADNAWRRVLQFFENRLR